VPTLGLPKISRTLASSSTSAVRAPAAWSMRAKLQAVRVERLAQPCLDLVGLASGGQLDHVAYFIPNRGQARDSPHATPARQRQSAILGSKWAAATGSVAKADEAPRYLALTETAH
jgi:hypothetical protein